MSRDDSLPETIVKLERELIKMKSRQAISGDSWKTYRYVTSASIPANTQRFAVFTTDYDIPTVAKLDQEATLFEVYPTGIINTNTVHVWALPVYSSTRTQVIGVTSSQPGTLTIQSSY